ncbi:dipeptidyl aminopeptidase/acylaminoacyl peptidase [Dysgonomonadaceae bacterium PH5-43]|nr:dipeptidyl aminopeptidase/acylaminoacyl peptidase [Dysgonomonadaceae bacterium PH5-43]
MKKVLLSLCVMTMLMSACDKTNNNEVVIGKANVDASSGRLTPEILHQLAQISGVEVSPDGQTVLYSVSYGDIELNKRNRELFTVKVDGSDKKQITQTAKNENGAQWIKNGEKIAFIYGGQIWEMNPDGSGRTQLSNYDGGIEGFCLSPDGTKVLFISQVKSVESASDKYNDLDKATGRIIDDLMYKHWDEWVTTIPHPFIADFDGKSLSNITDIMKGEPYESPMKPFGGIEQLAWSPDSKTVAYTSRKLTGKEYSLSTNSDIYFYNLETKETRNMTEGMMGYDTNPSFSPDGKHLAWQSMERDGYESDKNRLFLMDIHTGTKKDITQYFDYDVDSFCWDNNSNTIYFVSNVMGTYQIHSVNALEPVVAEGYITKITDGTYDFASVALAGDYLVGLRRSMSCPPEVYSVNLADGSLKNLSEENTDILAQITMGKVEGRWVKTTDNKEMWVWVIYPPHFDANKKYPALLYCQGGPQNSVSQTWSVRWNHQIMAANDYIVVAPSRRGVPGFGQEWKEQISGDYPGQNMNDYLSAIDAVAKEPYVDENRLGATGASYGGYSVYYLAGNHNKRFKAFLAHAGVFNQEAKYLETEEMFFCDWDLGGPYWDKSNATAQRTFANSPHKFVDRWDTPIMITHGELDYRILASQGMMAFNAAQLRNIPSRLLVFPDENHWILQPQNGVLFQREFFRWFDEWLK